MGKNRFDTIKWMDLFFKYKSQGESSINKIPGDVTVEYFLGGKSLGKYPIVPMSTVQDRKSVAQEKEIDNLEKRCIAPDDAMEYALRNGRVDLCGFLEWDMTDKTWEDLIDILGK